MTLEQYDYLESNVSLSTATSIAITQLARAAMQKVRQRAVEKQINAAKNVGTEAAGEGNNKGTNKANAAKPDVQQGTAGDPKKVIIPNKVRDVANQVKTRNGAPPEGYKGGRVYNNIPIGSGQKLPEGVNYKEYDVNPYVKGQDRGMERIVIGDDGSVWYTNDHYATFTRVE